LSLTHSEQRRTDMISDDDMSLDDVVKRLEDLSKYDKKIAEELEKMEESLSNGIWIKNPGPCISYSQMDCGSWKSIAASKLRELKAVLERMPSDSRYAFSRDNKNRMDNIICQLLVIASNYPIEADFRIGEDLNTFAFGVLEFSRSLPFLIGRVSEGFDKEISKILTDIENLIKRFA
jgi:hypothetical protein